MPLDSLERAALPLEASRGVRVLLRERRAPCVPPASPEPSAAQACDHVVVATANGDAARVVYGDRLGLRLALDREFPQWGVRLLFFRTGKLTIEIAASCSAPSAESGMPSALPDDDRLWGITWRVGDVAAAHARLASAGIATSEIRRGRRPGTSVFTVLGETHGAATLLLGPEPASLTSPATS